MSIYIFGKCVLGLFRMSNSYLSFTVIYYAWRAKSGYPTTFGQSTPNLKHSSITTTTASTTTSVISCKIFWITLITYFKLPKKTRKNGHTPAQLKASKRHSQKYNRLR